MNNKFALQLSDGEFRRIQDLVYDSIGVSLTEAKRALVVSRLSRRLREIDINSFSEYLDYLERNPKELEEIMNRITTGVTRFFREKHHFQYLKQEYLPYLEGRVKEKGIKPCIRAWSAGCSTGEEPYTLAMVLDNFFGSKNNWRLKMLASDINTEVLNKARQGIYSRQEIEGIPYSLLTRYFQLGTGQNEGKLKVKDGLRRMITFRKINLSRPNKYPLADPLHIIFCRNVFIYFNRETQNMILNAFHRHLIPNGLLFLGHSESIDADTAAGKWRLIKHTIYRRLD